MPKQTAAQQKKISNVMHEYKEGDLKSSTGAKVKSRKQAIAIGLSEAGASSKQKKSASKKSSAKKASPKKTKTTAAKKTTAKKSTATRKKAR